MKLLFLDHCAGPSGAEIALLRLLDALRARYPEHEVTVILAEDAAPHGRAVIEMLDPSGLDELQRLASGS